MKKTNITLAIIMFLPSIIFAQNYLTDGQEQTIKLSGKYYWDEGNDFNDAKACQYALNNLTERILSEAVYQTKKREEVLKELELNAHIGRIQQEGMICAVAWIAKDSVFVTTQRPLNRPQEPNRTPPSSNKVESSVSKPNPITNTNMVEDPVLRELMSCKNYREINKVANRSGIVKGELNTSAGFDKPGLCLIAVFDANGSLVALLDKGGSSRIDLLSGETIHDPESQYRNKGYNIWYLQRK